MSTVSKKPRKPQKRSNRGGLRHGSGRPPNPNLFTLELVRHSFKTKSDKEITPTKAAAVLLDGMKRAAGDDPSAVDYAEAAAHAARVSAYRTKRPVSRVCPNGKLEELDRRPPPPCKCKVYREPHQHCAKRGCGAISEAQAVDPWFLEDRVWGYPEPKGWHCERHLTVTKQCVGARGNRCGKPVAAYISYHIVRCQDCQRLADEAAIKAASEPSPS